MVSVSWGVFNLYQWVVGCLITLLSSTFINDRAAVLFPAALEFLNLIFNSLQAPLSA